MAKHRAKNRRTSQGNRPNPPDRAPDPDWVSGAEAARRIGITPQAIGLWAAKPGAPVRMTDGKLEYQWPAFARWREQELVGGTRARSNGLAEAEQRKMTAGARKLELEVAQLEATLMPVSVHERRLRERCEELAGRVKGLNQWVLKIRAARTEDDADRIAEQMEDHLLAALRGAADEIPDEPGPNDGQSRRAA